MRRRHIKVLAVAALATALIALITAWATPRPPNSDVELRVSLGEPRPGYACLCMEASYTVTLTRGGEEVLRIKKDGDPITHHFYRLVANTLLGFFRRSTPLSWVNITGAARSVPADTEYGGVNPLMYVAIGTGTGTLSPARNAMFSLLTMNPVNSSALISHTDTGSSRVITYTRPFTFTSSHTVTEVALILEVDVNMDTGTSLARVLVAHDLLPQPVSVAPGDVLTVTYTITIPYSEGGPITRNFYNALVNYMLGYTRATGTRLTMIHQGGSSGPIDTPGVINCEFIHVELGTGTPTVQPYYVHNLANRVARVRSTDPAFVMGYREETARVVIEYVVGVPFTSAQSVREVALTFNTDVDPGSGFSENYYVWLYWSLPTPISVNAGDSVRVRIVIELPTGA